MCCSPPTKAGAADTGFREAGRPECAHPSCPWAPESHAPGGAACAGTETERQLHSSEVPWAQRCLAAAVRGGALLGVLLALRLCRELASAGRHLGVEQDASVLALGCPTGTDFGEVIV